MNFGPEQIQFAINDGEFPKWLDEMIEPLPKKKRSAPVNDLTIRHGMGRDNDNDEEKSGDGQMART